MASCLLSPSTILREIELRGLVPEGFKVDAGYLASYDALEIGISNRNECRSFMLPSKKLALSLNEVLSIVGPSITEIVYGLHSIPEYPVDVSSG